MITNPMLAATGRMKSFIENPDRGTLPASCTQLTLKASFLDDIKELFYFVQKALVTAAGVNVHLDGFDSSFWPKDNLGYLFDYFVDPPLDGPHPSIILKVQDSMDYDPNEPGDISIMDASFYIFRNTLAGIDTYLDTSLIRKEGTISSKGQISSGPKSFWQIFRAAHTLAHDQTIESLLTLLSTFNMVIRRGGIYKNGAVTTSLPIWNTHFAAYASAHPPYTHPWLKKGAVVPKDWQEFPVEMYLAFEAVNRGDLWLEKAIAEDGVTWLKAKSTRTRLGHNVCREILLKSKGTCILLPINYGLAKEPQDLVQAYVEGMDYLCKFQKADHQAKAGIYLGADVDKQVGLGLLGFANLLKLEAITYQDFVNEFSKQIGYLKHVGVNGKKLKLQDYAAMGYQLSPHASTNVAQWVAGIIQAHSDAAHVADRHGMDRAFAIAPTANVSYRQFDREGFRCTPEISPPLGTKVERLSSTVEETEVFDYGNVEVAKDVSFGVYFDLANLFQTLMDLTGLGHSISFNLWQNMDFDLMQRFDESNLKATYYHLDIDVDFLDKSDQVQSIGSSCGLDGSGCGN
jgi:hypothetical protein